MQQKYQADPKTDPGICEFVREFEEYSTKTTGPPSPPSVLKTPFRLDQKVRFAVARP